MNVGANYLREHIIPDGRLHYVITNGGGTAPNFVPPFAESKYYVRAPLMKQADQIYQRLVVGSCLAACGMDREAAGAWQTALIEERGVPVLYTLLADAWLRLNDPARALEVLTRAATRWPADADVKRRRVVALARAGRRSEALSEVDTLLAASPGDAASACVGFRIALDRSVAGGVPEEKKRAYATACAAGEAPESPLAAGWLKAPGKRAR